MPQSQSLLPSTKTRGTQDQSSTPSITKKKSKQSDREILDVTDTLIDEIDDVLEVEVETSEILTLGDLIRNGSKLNPQAIGSWKGARGETCALSAALEGAQALGLV